MSCLNIFVLIACLSASAVLAVPLQEGCSLEVDVNALNFPLLFNEKGRIHPKYNAVEDKWFLRLKSEELFTAACPSGGDTSNHFQHMQQNVLELKCVYGSLVKSVQGITSFKNLYCSKALQEVITRNGTCYNGYTKVNIEFPTANPPYTLLLTACHNEEIDETIYSQHVLYGTELGNAEPVGNRPSFREGGFYTQIVADDCYKQAQQTTTIAELVGSRQLAEHYVQPSRNLFMARGHFTPSGDPIYAFEKKATFYFFNASPQWQTINGGNFERLESTIRTLAANLNATFTIWTGSYGNMKLNDINNNPVEIWLGKGPDGNQRLPVAHLTWKVIHNQKHNSAIAVTQINNPWLTSVSQDDILCPDVCDSVSWIESIRDRTNITMGYTYCCDVASFKRAVPYAPDLGNLPLLDYPSI